MNSTSTPIERIPDEMRVFQHVAGKARVLADDDFVAARARGLGFQIFEDMGGGAAQFERGFRGDWLDVGRAANTVRAKNFLGSIHGCKFNGRLFTGETCSTSGGARHTWMSVTPLGIFNFDLR